MIMVSMKKPTAIPMSIRKFQGRPLYAAHKRLFTVIILISAVIFLIGLLLTKFREDDLWFAQHVVNYTPLGWVAYRWGSWSSRIFPEFMLWLYAPRNMGWWVVTSMGAYLCQVILMFKYYRLLQPFDRSKLDALVLILICNFMWLLDSSVVSSSVLWLTGSINYFWMGVLFLAALYSPLYVFMKDRLPSRVYLVLSAFMGIIVASSHEQLGIVLIEITTVTLIALVFRRKRNEKVVSDPKKLWYVIVCLALYTALYLRSILAPGNRLRAMEETAQRLPNMHTISVSLRLESDIRWFMDSIINHTGALPILILFTLAAILAMRKQKVRSIIMGLAGLILLAAKSVGSGLAIGDLFTRLYAYKIVDFHASWGFAGSLRSWAVVLFWIVMLLSILMNIVSVFRGHVAKQVLASTLCVSAASTIALLWFSPTMYASGVRVLYVSNLLFAIVLIMLVVEFFSKYQLTPRGEYTLDKNAK